MAHPTAHGTLVANSVTTVDLDLNVSATDTEVVVAYRGSAEGVIWYTLDGTTPVAAAAGTYMVSNLLPAASHKRIDRGWNTDEGVQVKMLSTIAAPYSVLGFQGA